MITQMTWARQNELERLSETICTFKGPLAWEIEGRRHKRLVRVTDERDWTGIYLKMVRSDVSEGAKHMLRALKADTLGH